MQRRYIDRKGRTITTLKWAWATLGGCCGKSAKALVKRWFWVIGHTAHPRSPFPPLNWCQSFPLLSVYQMCARPCGFQVVICSSYSLLFHLYGIFRLVASHLLLSHLTGSLGMSPCAFVCVHICGQIHDCEYPCRLSTALVRVCCQGVARSGIVGKILMVLPSLSSSWKKANVDWHTQWAERRDKTERGAIAH